MLVLVFQITSKIETLKQAQAQQVALLFNI
jgi:hypothetical protein